MTVIQFTTTWAEPAVIVVGMSKYVIASGPLGDERSSVSADLSGDGISYHWEFVLYWSC